PQVGFALGAARAGWIYEWTGGYEIALVSAAFMGIVAAGLALAIREEPVTSRAPPPAAPAPSRPAPPRPPRHVLIADLTDRAPRGFRTRACRPRGSPSGAPA